MKAITCIAVFLLLIVNTINAQVGKMVINVKLVDVNDKPQSIPFLGNKVFAFFYVDPDVQDIVDPLTEAMNSKKYPKDKLGAIGGVNCKDTWFPNSVILSKARQKQEKFPESLILLDKAYQLPNAWGLGRCDDMAVIIIVGKDRKIKYIKTVNSRNACQAIIPVVTKIIENELNKL